MANHSSETMSPVASTDLTLRTAYLASAFCTAIAVIYALSSAEAAPAVMLFASFGPIVAVCAWLQKDARVTGISSVLDWGFFIYLFWPIVIPWYAFKTRGRSGWRLAATLLGLACAPMIASYVVWFVLMILYILSPA